MSNRDDFELAYIECLGDARFNGLTGFLRDSRVNENAYQFNLPLLSREANLIATGCINSAWWAWRHQDARYGIMQDKEAGHVVH